MKISAIIPVKTFSKSKSRLDLPSMVKEDLCSMMLDEVLCTLSMSAIHSIIIISKDQKVFDVAKKFDVIKIKTDQDKGVNDAVARADKIDNFDASIVFPQDVPFMKKEDIDFLLRFQSSRCALITPSRKFDGTNALLRAPTDLMATHYDEDSYKIHLHTGRKIANTSIIFIKRIMMDIDDAADLRYCLKANEKPDLCARIAELTLSSK